MGVLKSWKLISIAMAILLCLQMVTLILMPVASSAADPVVNFPDTNLEAAIRTAISKPVGEIYASDLTSLDTLTVWNKGVTNLAGLEYCINLWTLRLSVNQISNLTPLSNLTQLRWLYLTTNKISDLSPLAGLTNLLWLDLGTNQISDLTPLKNLTNLTCLWLSQNQISDLDSLAGLTNLYTLFLGQNNISNLTKLAGLTNLQVLGLYQNQITDIGPLVLNAGLAAGDNVYLTGNNLNAAAINVHIPALQARGVTVVWDVPACCSGTTVTTGNILLIDNDSQTSLYARAKGSLTCMGSALSALTSYEYWTSDNLTINCTQTQTATTPGYFTIDLNGLSYDKTYIYRAKAIICGSTFYGDNITFYSVPSWRANIQPGDILYSYPGSKTSLLNAFTFFCSLIRPDIKHKYFPKAAWNATALISHTALYVGDNNTIEARWNTNVLDAGVYKTNIKDWDSYHENKDNVTLLRLKSTGDPIKDLTYKTQAVNFATKQIPPDSTFLNYNIEAYLEGLKNQCILSPTGSWYCSELVWASYWYGGQGINIESSQDIPDGGKILCQYWDPVLPSEIRHSPRLEDKGHHLRPDLAAVESKMVFVMSPVDIIIVTPDGHTIKKGYSDLAGASYDELDIDGDGDTESIVYIPGMGVGNYSISIIPHAGANPAETFSIFFADSQTGTYIFPCIDTAVSNIPKQGYIVNWNGNKFTSNEDNSILTPPIQQIITPRSSAQTPPPPPQLPIALPSIIVQSASLSATKVKPDSPVTVNATVVNRGTVNGTIKIKLYINGQEETSESITVTSGGIKPVSFTISRNQPGTYAVYVGGTSAGSFIVDEFADPNIILYISLSAIFFAFVLGLIIIVRRNSYH